MENTYSKQRREELLGLLDPRLTNSEQADALAAFVEREIASAYRRGRRGPGGSTRGGARRSQCCDAPMVNGGAQCEACGSDGKVEERADERPSGASQYRRPTRTTGAPVDRARMTSAGRPLRYSSAVQAGVLKRVV